MAEPEKEIIRNAVPPRPEATPAIPPRRSPPPSPIISSGPQVESPMIPLRRPPVLPPLGTASPILQPLPKLAGAPQISSKPAASENFARVSVPTGPRKETARIALQPRRSPAAVIVQPAPGVVATSDATDAFDSIPRGFCWGLFGISALIFLIEIWNYTLS
jgi:hypothetical protein